MSDNSQLTERKVMIALCVMCLLVFLGSLIALAFWTHVGLGLISLALVAWWIGSSIAETLEKTRDTSSPNTELGRAQRRP